METLLPWLKIDLPMKKSVGFLYVGFMFLSFFSKGQPVEIFITQEGAIQGYREKLNV
jgi:hypothetical protein